jgi:hypothetical protein
MTHAEVHEAIALIKRVLAEDPVRQEFTLKISRQMSLLILDFFQSMDPDMPPRPIMKALGPLVGDYMMNDKLARLDDIADSLGPQVMRLPVIADQLEGLNVRRRR